MAHRNGVASGHLGRGPAAAGGHSGGMRGWGGLLGVIPALPLARAETFPSCHGFPGMTWGHRMGESSGYLRYLMCVYSVKSHKPLQGGDASVPSLHMKILRFREVSWAQKDEMNTHVLHSPHTSLPQLVAPCPPQVSLVLASSVPGQPLPQVLPRGIPGSACLPISLLSTKSVL